MTHPNFPRQNRLLTGRDFRAVRKGKSFVGKCLVVEVIPSEVGHARLGLAASKRYGNACQRNRFKRLVREAFRLLPLEPLDIVVRPRKLALGATFEQISTELQDLLKSAN